MYHVDNSTGIPVMPQPSPVTSETELFFTEGGNGVPPTYPGPDWFNTIQSELLNILRSAGLDPDKMDNTQILAALKKLFLSRSNPFGDIKADGAAAIATALSNLGLDTALAAKQPLDATLTGLSGKDDAGLRAYLSLKSAATRDVGSQLGQLPGMDLFSSTIAGTGEKSIPDFNTGTGIFILKWGAIVSPTAPQDVTTLFQTPFPNKCLRVFAIADYAPGSGNVMYVSVNNSTLQRDRFVARFAGSANYTSGVYLALGY
ncbi:gp53-like domain-containing protein [Citrobacter portucalensis]